jgi:hypothetical protein
MFLDKFVFTVLNVDFSNVNQANIMIQMYVKNVQVLKVSVLHVKVLQLVKPVWLDFIHQVEIVLLVIPHYQIV